MKKAVKIVGIVLAAVAALAVVLIGAAAYLYHDFRAGPADPPLGPLEQQVQQRLQEKLGTGAARIELAQLTDFPWDQVCVVQIYSNKDHLNQAAGTKLRGYDSIGWIDNRKYWTLAFIAGKEIKAVRIPIRTFGRYGPTGAFAECAPRADAAVTVHAQTGNGIPPRAFYLVRR